ncbi:hypothetical protein RRH01S_06_00050 [Rhizobium rhizogenes NBRC 13257]|uniref:Uncharacterized protein n=1 Tax=Rhizobium rhizogenes NBRC 13257 TaxID=1220581 RepID=A0AA87U477_RHIRH|nr:hypothetical protein RRH01S_06_00050 [Rhizobium rhizogenes NBRC 13257]
MLASGHADIVVEIGFRPYDDIAWISAVRGTGGCIAGWEGTELTIHSEGSSFVMKPRLSSTDRFASHALHDDDREYGLPLW